MMGYLPYLSVPIILFAGLIAYLRVPGITRRNPLFVIMTLAIALTPMLVHAAAFYVTYDPGFTFGRRYWGNLKPGEWLSLLVGFFLIGMGFTFILRPRRLQEGKR